MRKTLIEFHDRRQGFQYWAVDEHGKVTRSWPEHNHTWLGIEVTNLIGLKSGGVVEFLLDGHPGRVESTVRSVKPLTPIDVPVSLIGGNYCAGFVQGPRAYSLQERCAVKLVAEKIFAGYPFSIERLDPQATGGLDSKWRITPEGCDMSEISRTRQAAIEYPYGSTVKLKYYNDDSCIGWAHRGDNGELLSAYGRTPLDPDAWTVVEERED
ncbi:hypothetical protein [Pseudomonas chlororaphis]|uniref:Uncharacterized protein n=1 Tax=Pseudomonas chlororaphis TaxID=587753 RepID=A0A1Q8EPP4_9PSED|nr:hypothetical protein [Pseudomonas chlororaphis]OLF53767.1 hypothetical protein BTN82_14960 [Pseudomonas chlororaphis]